MNNPDFEQKNYEISHDIAYVDQAISLCDEVFNQNSPSIYNNKEEWLRRINNGGYFIVSRAASKTIGFVVCNLTESGDFYIWLVGVSPEARGLGVWSAMYDDVTKHAKSKGYKHVLIKTTPAKFPAMFSFLQKVGAEIYKEEEIDGETKVYARLLT